MIYWKNSSLTLTKNNTKIEYISGGQPLSYKLVFEIKLLKKLNLKLIIFAYTD